MPQTAFSRIVANAPAGRALSGGAGRGVWYHVARLGIARFAGRLKRDCNGTPAMEFALVGAPFVVMIFAIFEVALSLLAQSSLETAAEQAARLLATGQAQTFQSYTGSTLNTGMTAAQFKQAVCGTLSYNATANASTTTSYGSGLLPPFMTCGNLVVNVSSAASFSAANLTSPTFTYDAAGNVTATGTGYVTTAGTGGQQQILVVQLIYLWPTLTGMFGLTLANQANGTQMLVATQVISTEDYICPTGASTC